MEPQVVTDNEELSRFEIHDGGVPGGFAEYRRTGGEIAFTHTETDPAFAGRGLAGRMVRAALDSARERGLAVLPYCSYVRGWIERHPEYAELVPAARREEFGLPAPADGAPDGA